MEAARIPARLLGLTTMAEISNIWYGNYNTPGVFLSLGKINMNKGTPTPWLMLLLVLGIIKNRVNRAKTTT